MSRYVNIERLKAEFDEANEISFFYLNADSREAFEELKKIVEQAPSIDIVPRKAVKGYEGYYEVDMYGRVYSLERTITVNDNGRIYEKPVKECELSQSTHSAGYKTVGLTRDGKTETAYVHRLVAEAYIPNPQNLPFINHKDENKANNFVTNLEWCTVQYNNTYGDKNERQANAIRGRKHTQEHIEKIRRSNMGRHGKQKEVVCVDDGKRFLYYGISPKTVKSCCERRSQGRKKTFRYADDFCSCGERKEP